jgi:ribosome-associated protein YbcJ (S4-like RNA binding protein)
MDPITLILGILAVIAVAVVVELVILTVEWLTESFNSLKTGDVDEIGFTVKNALENGQVEVIQGVFNKRTEEVVNDKVVKINTDQLDPQLEMAHRDNAVVLYT